MKIAVIGVGAMGGAMVEGFVKSGAFRPADITASAPHKSTLDRFSALGVNVTTDNKEAVMAADVIVVAVKPWLAETVLGEIKPFVDYQRQSLVSVMAGIGSDKLKSMMTRDDGSLPQMFIVIPNIAIAVLSSMTFITAVTADEASVAKIKDVFDKTGLALVVDERQLSAGIVLASCGIAYAMRYIRAATEGGVELGFKAHQAQRIVEQTVKGAVDLLQAGGGHPEAEIDKVTTPGGLTVRGLNEMEHAGFTSAVIRGLKAGLK